MRLNEYFDRVFLINTQNRPDRLAQCQAEGEKHEIWFERFDGHMDVMEDVHTGVIENRHRGCTASHRGLLEIIAHNKWERVLILEDDFQVVHDDFQERFSAYIKELPSEWDMLYLGGHYQEAPKYRHSEHIIRINGMLTTSSYGITWQQARKMAPYIFGVGPIDALYRHWNKKDKCYCLDPRLVVQSPGKSEIQQRFMDNSVCMLDSSHVDALNERDSRGNT